jgi:F-type H+-transporting ATPase subunit b
MAGNTTKVIVAQAENGDVLQQGIVVEGADEVPAEEPVHIETTGEEHPEEHAAFPPFDSTYFGSQLFWLALTFIVLYVVMSRVALPRILKEADRLRVETERAMAAYEQALAEARANAHGIAEETRTAIKADLEGKRSTVEAELARKLADAEARIQKTKVEAMANVDDIAAETVAELVGKLAGKVSTAQARAAVAAVAKE